MNQLSLFYPCLTRPLMEDADHANLLKAYNTHLLQERGILSTKCHLYVADSFLAMLKNSQCKVEAISTAHIQKFIIEQGRHYKRKTIALIASHLRSFLRFLAFNRHTPKDLSQSVQRPFIFQGEREPRYLQDWQVHQILSSINQSSIQGKRNYAILLLLAVYGLRANEVVRLQIENCLWRVGKLLICDRKCGDTMELPLTTEVAESLIAYLQVRPKTEHREIFLRIQNPHTPLRKGSMNKIVAKAIHRCGFTVAHPGSHTFRYSFAQALFAAQRPLPEIASMLGHRDLSTTLSYLSFTVHPLRELALSAGEDIA